MDFNHELHPAHWTVQALAQLGGIELENLTRRVVSTLGVCRLLLGRCLWALEENERIFRCGFSGAVHFAIQIGVDKRHAQEARLVVQRLEELPLLRAAAENAEIPWASLREIVRKATPDTEEKWLRLAKAMNYRKIERLVRRTRAGEAPCASRIEAEEVEVRLVLTPTVEQMGVLQEAITAICHEEGRRLPSTEALELVCAEFLAGRGINVNRVRADAVKDEAAKLQAEDRELEVDLQEPARGEVPVAVAAQTVEHWSLTLLKSARAHWENGRLKFNRKARSLTPAQQGEILRRDGHACSTPGCPNRLWLAVHHIVFYSRGGATLPDNLVVVCSRCHSNIHEGHLRVAGTAPAGLTWSDSRGRSLLPPPLPWLGLLGVPADG